MLSHFMSSEELTYFKIVALIIVWGTNSLLLCHGSKEDLENEWHPWTRAEKLLIRRAGVLVGAKAQGYLSKILVIFDLAGDGEGRSSIRSQFVSSSSTNIHHSHLLTMNGC